jgi:hypothetical protein
VHGGGEHREHLSAHRADRGRADEVAGIPVLDELDDPLAAGAGDPAAGRRRERRPADGHLDPGVAGLLLGEADRADLGVGEGHPRHRVVLGLAGVVARPVGDVGEGHGRLVHRHVGERALAGDVADRPQLLAGPHPPVGVDRPGAGVQAHRLQPHVAEVGAAPGGDEQAVRPELDRRAAGVGERHGEAAVTVVHRADRRSGNHPDAVRGQRGGDDLRGLGLLESQHAGGRLDERDVAAEAREGLGQLRPDGTPADDDERRGEVGGLQGVAVGPERGVGEPVDGRRRGRGPGVEHDAARRREAPVPDLDDPRAGEAGVAPHEAHPGLLEALDGDRVLPVVGGLVADAGVHEPPVRPHLGGAGQRSHPAGVGEQVGGADRHLRRDAAPVRALAADEALVDADDGETGLRGLGGQVLTAGAEADHDEVHGGVGGHGPSQARGSGPRRGIGRASTRRAVGAGR